MAAQSMGMTWPGWMRPAIDEGHRNRGPRHDVAVAIWQRSLSGIPVAMHEAPASMRSNGGPCSGGARLAKQNTLPIEAAVGRVAAGWSAGLE